MTKMNCLKCEKPIRFFQRTVLVAAVGKFGIIYGLAHKKCAKK